MDGLTLKVLTPAGQAAEIACTGVTLFLPDGKDGRGGGSIGIRHNHAPALMALCESQVLALKGESVIARISIPGGFAEVRDNIVTVTASNAVVE